MSSIEANPPIAPDTLVSTESAGPVFFPVSVTKLIVMSTFTFGLYELYWFYRNWQHVKKNEESNIVPVLRAIFGIFFCYAFFERVKEEADDLNTRSIPAGWLAAGWILFSLFGRLPDPYWLLAFVASIFLLPVQISINAINQQIVPGHDSNNRFGAWNIVGIIIGSIFWVLVLIEFFYHPE